MPINSLNDGQFEAVVTRNCSILVSAPAGSGKTKILVNRIMALIEEEHYDVDQLLVLTFTNAAALEMKQRLQVALQQRLQEDINQQLEQHLLKQQQLLPKAYITNFHGFCSTLLKQYGYLININSKFDICTDPTIIKHQVIDYCIQTWVKDSSFVEFISTYFPEYYFNSFKNAIFKFENLSNTIYDFNNYLNEIKISIYNHIINGDNSSLTSWPINQKIIELLKIQATMGLNKVYELANFARDHNLTFYYQNPFDNSKPKKADLPSPFDCHLKYYHEVINAIDSKDMEKIISTSNAALTKSYDSRGLFDENNEEYKAEYNRLKNNVIKFYKDKFKDLVYEDIEEFKLVLSTSIEPLEKLIKYLEEYKQAYNKYKQDHNLIDFNDLEANALKLLQPQYGIANLLYNQLKEIMIDEYQDTNQIQETLINKIADFKEPKINRFMVGDMKQSIYRFREADPEIFNEKYLTFNHLPNTKRIDLKFNYRSNKIVLDCVNYIFNQIMDVNIGGLDYYLDDSAKLNYDFLRKEGAKELEDLTDVTLKASKRLEEEERFTSEVLLSYQTKTSSSDAELEAKIAAKKIQEIVGHLELDNFDKTKRKANYKDIVVLMRNTRSFIAFKKIFSRYNIPSHIVLSQGFLQASEIISIINVLKAFDNHLDDIAFTSLLKGNYVISCFDENMLAKIRTDENVSIYDNVLNYIETKQPNYQSLEKFINYYHQMREYFNFHSVKESLNKFYQDSEYLSFLASLVNGRQRVANLELLLQKMDEMKDESLHTIVTKFNKMMINGVNLSPAMVSSNDDNVVSFMTIHKSKGLEFPIVFVSNLQNKFNQQDARERIISDKKLGIAIKPRIKQQLEPYQDVICEYENKYRKIIASYQTNEAINEEMRIFYVALTRASQKLILTGLIKDPQDIIKWQNYVINNNEDSIVNPRCNDKVILYHNARRQNSYLDWLGISLMSHDDIIAQGINKELLDNDNSDEIINEVKHNFQTIMIHKNKNLTKENTKHSKFSIKIYTHKEIEQQILITNQKEKTLDLVNYDRYNNFKYPYLSNLDKAIAVTRKIEDGDRTFNNVSYDFDDSNIDGATRGTIIHSVLENFDLKLGLDDNLALLKKYGLYDQEAWKIIDKYYLNLKNFLSSEVYSLMCNAKIVYKEKEFSMLDEGQIIHGIFDVVCINDNNITIIDYKTDNIKSSTCDELLVSLHKDQMDYYKKILARVFPQANIKAIVYYLHINKYITI
ncbi:UvrD-helicase domain-containing protein [Thomasclavelia cocleata]|uniref:UvrD-helicase domain-containing protein n=1 Tax=Thomasclavelia cocleata TaxID=69824 RepID=UPI002558041E|nr:UvrD-helicase domain-containing protein [Thomasclavelia cocleata]